MGSLTSPSIRHHLSFPPLIKVIQELNEGYLRATLEGGSAVGNP